MVSAITVTSGMTETEFPPDSATVVFGRKLTSLTADLGLTPVTTFLEVMLERTRSWIAVGE